MQTSTISGTSCQSPGNHVSSHVLTHTRRHDWDDDRALAILTALRPALGPNSRILVCDQVLNTTLGSPAIAPAPAPLPANYGTALRMAHCRDLNMLTLSNGQERTPEDLAQLAARAGLRVERVWPCRGLIWITELRRAG